MAERRNRESTDCKRRWIAGGVVYWTTLPCRATILNAKFTLKLGNPCSGAMTRGGMGYSHAPCIASTGWVDLAVSPTLAAGGPMPIVPPASPLPPPHWSRLERGAQTFSPVNSPSRSRTSSFPHPLFRPTPSMASRALFQFVAIGEPVFSG